MRTAEGANSNGKPAARVDGNLSKSSWCVFLLTRYRDAVSRRDPLFRGAFAVRLPANPVSRRGVPREPIVSWRFCGASSCEPGIATRCPAGTHCFVALLRCVFLLTRYRDAVSRRDSPCQPWVSRRLKGKAYPGSTAPTFLPQRGIPNRRSLNPTRIAHRIQSCASSTGGGIRPETPSCDGGLPDRECIDGPPYGWGTLTG